MMRRVNGLAVLGRAIAANGGAAFSTAAGSGVAQRQQILGSCSGHTRPVWFPQPLPDCFGQSRSSVAHGVPAAVRFSSAAATSVAQDVHAREKFQPKDVVLYQYEACPFCNKLKGKKQNKKKKRKEKLALFAYPQSCNENLIQFSLRCFVDDCPVLVTTGKPLHFHRDNSAGLLHCSLSN